MRDCTGVGVGLPFLRRWLNHRKSVASRAEPIPRPVKILAQTPAPPFAKSEKIIPPSRLTRTGNLRFAPAEFRGSRVFILRLARVFFTSRARRARPLVQAPARCRRGRA